MNIALIMIQVGVVTESWCRRSWKRKDNSWIMVLGHWATSHLLWHLNMVGKVDMGVLIDMAEITIARDIVKMIATDLITQREFTAVNL
nr:uncharacterized protein LOC107777914 isoform X2 [Ipomoea batatas]